MPRVASKLAVALAACTMVSRNAHAEDDLVGLAVLSADVAHGFHGGELGVAAGFHGVIPGLDVFGASLSRASDRATFLAGGADISLRISVLGIALHDHRLEHWIDFGGDFGAGGGFTPGLGDPLSFGHVWAGAFAQIGLAPGDAYPALMLGVRRVSSTAPWASETVFSIGLAWVGRTDTLLINNR